MSPAQEILKYSKHCSTVYSNESISQTGLLSTKEMEFMKTQSNSSIFEIVTACQTKLNLGLEYFYAVQQQLTSTQQAWAAVIAEKERCDTIGWQAGTTSFTRALHVCLYMIPNRLNMTLPGPFHGARGTRGYTELGGSTPAVFDNGHDLPDYADSVCESVEFEDWGSLDTTGFVKGGGKDREWEEGDRDDAKKEGGKHLIHELVDTPEKRSSKDFPVFDPWEEFLSEQKHPQFTANPLKRSVRDNESSKIGVQAGCESKRRRMK